MRDRVVDTTVRIDFQTNDADGAPVAPSSAFVASDFRIYKDGSATQKATTNGITVTSPFDSVVGDHLIEIDTSNDTDDAGFWGLGSEYRIKINSAKTVDGQVQTGVKVGEFRLVSGTVELDSASVNAVADQVWDEAYADHNTAGSFGKLLNTIRKANLAIDGTVSNAITPTTLTFSSNVAATTSAYAHAVLLFTTGPLAGENSPIISYTNTNGVFLLEESLTAAPSNGDEFVVIAGSHVHSVADIQSGLASQSSVNTLTSYVDTEVAAIKAKTDNLPADPADASDVAASFVTVNTKLDTIDDFLDTEITAIKTKTDQFVFTVPNKVDASATLTGGGDATLAKQTEILTAIGEISTAQLAAITVESGVISNFPDTLTIGDSYDTDTGWIKVLITDEANDPITGLGGLLFSEADVSFTAFRPNDSARVYGVCEFVDAGSETYVKLTLTSEETTKGLPEYTYEGRLKFVWDSTSASSDLVDSRQKTYKTTPFKFIANP